MRFFFLFSIELYIFHGKEFLYSIAVCILVSFCGILYWYLETNSRILNG